jgi:hypothetical protein
MKVTILTASLAFAFLSHLPGHGEMKRIDSAADTTTIKISKKDNLANDGSSFEKAVYITEAQETPGIHAEYAWIRNKYPGSKTRGQSLNIHEKKPYDIIHITTADGKDIDVYFDISKFYGKF